MRWEDMMKDSADAGQIPDIPPVPPENVTTQQLFMMMMSQNARISVLLHRVTVLADAQKDMVETWRTAGNVLKFLKMLSIFGAAMVALWGIVKAIFHHPGQGPS